MIEIVCNVSDFLEVLRRVRFAWASARLQVLTGMSADQLLDMHNRFDVGHEIVLPERARKDHT